MKNLSTDNHATIVTETKSANNTFAGDVRRGLSNSPKHLPSMYFYDYAGSILFEEICQLPEYYLTRKETEILQDHSEEIISLLPKDIQLVELGSGSAIKTELIIEEMLNQHDKVVYSPIDISEKMLMESSSLLLEKYENLEINSVAAEYDEGLRQIDMQTSQAKLILWLGSSIGNFEKVTAIAFVKNLLQSSSSDDYFLFGFDLIKDRKILLDAYNDSQGVTAQFNLNLLKRINRELAGEFDLDNFIHKAIYNEEKNRIEMHLKSTCEQDIYIADLDASYYFEKDETIHTENSHKFSQESIHKLAEQTGLTIFKQWFDEKHYFNLTLFKPACR